MNHQLANQTLMAILFNFAYSDGFYETCRKAGIAGRPWPEFEGSKLLERFESTARTKTIKAAMYEVSDALNFENKKATLPKDLDSLKAVFDSACDYLFARELVGKLRTNPQDFRQLIQEYAPNSKTTGSDVKSIEQMIAEFVKENERRIEANEFEVIIPGWPTLSTYIGGFNPGRLTIITAGTGVGKTNLCMNLSTCLWKSSIPSLYINMEMDLHDVSTRFLTAQLNIERRELKSENYIQKINPLGETLSEKKNTLFFTSGRSLSLTDIEVMATEHKQKHGIKFLFVDYDQKINSDSSDDEWKHIQKSCEALEETAKRLKIHVVLLAQADGDGDGVPRASKRMLQSASTALFFKRDNDRHFLKAIKNRHGENGFELELQYDPVRSSIKEGQLATIQQILSQQAQQKAKSHDPKNFR
jgi:hypothetical protein